MGRPSHYSAELPRRCAALIEGLSDAVDALTAAPRWGGPLRTTFLVSMATPMIVLPFERLFQPGVRQIEGVGNDLLLDPDLDARIRTELEPGRRFDATPFFLADAFSYAPKVRRFPIGSDWSLEVLESLGAEAAFAAAGAADAADILSILRNALAHGGVTYLDRDGRQVNAATAMLAFASFVSRKDRDHLRLLRISVPAFERFLSLWAGWLTASGAADRMEHDGPVYFRGGRIGFGRRGSHMRPPA